MAVTHRERVLARAHRTLKPMSRYQTATTNTVLPDGFQPDDELLGIYRNDSNVTDVMIAVQAIYIHEGEWIPLPYGSIQKATVVQHSPDDKRTAYGVTVQLNSGSRHFVPVNGGNERFRDAWEFLHYLNRVSLIFRESKQE